MGFSHLEPIRFSGTSRPGEGGQTSTGFQIQRPDAPAISAVARKKRGKDAFMSNVLGRKTRRVMGAAPTLPSETY
jgi:hypothetical protein